MKKHLAIVMAILFLAPAYAMAQTVLVSAPLEPGAGGLVCSCTNLTKDPLIVDFKITGYLTSSNCLDRTIHSGSVNYCEKVVSAPRLCKVSRDDRKSLSTKHLACTLSAIDGSGNPTSTVPVDKKFKQ